MTSFSDRKHCPALERFRRLLHLARCGDGAHCSATAIAETSSPAPNSSGNAPLVSGSSLRNPSGRRLSQGDRSPVAPETLSREDASEASGVIPKQRVAGSSPVSRSRTHIQRRRLGEMPSLLRCPCVNHLVLKQRARAPPPAFGSPGLPLAALPDTDGILAPHKPASSRPPCSATPARSFACGARSGAGRSVGYSCNRISRFASR
jgi:hypothetical protein